MDFYLIAGRSIIPQDANVPYDIRDVIGKVIHTYEAACALPQCLSSSFFRLWTITNFLR